MLPSGSVVSRIVDVAETDGHVDAALDAPMSPHEWLSWQQWSGNIAQQAVSVQPAFTPVSPAANIRAFLVPRAVGQREAVWDSLAQLLTTLDRASNLSSEPLLAANAHPVPITVMEDGPYVAVKMPDQTLAPEGRSYLVAELHGQKMLSVVPWPWQQSDRSGFATVEAVVAESQVDRVWSVRIGVRDHRLASLLSYFANGEERLARELIAPATDALLKKYNNPLAAAAGAYILVDQWIDESTQGKSSKWMKWVGNLSASFPWIPDGAILEAWLALRMRGREPQITEARAALLEAERRGIPFYTAGVRRLIDGLMLVAGEATRAKRDDPDVSAALARVRRLAWQIDPVQPFTSVRLWS